MSTTSPTSVAGIMAAGQGRRLGAVSQSKPFARVGGRPLIDHVLEQCLEAGILRVVVTIGFGDTRLEQHVSQESRFPGGVTVVAIKPGCGTGRSLHALAKEIGPSPCLISAVDTIAPKGAYQRLIKAAEKAPIGTLAVVLATTYVHDDEPIWIVSDITGRVRRLAKGIPPTGLVFGNVRWLAATACEFIASLNVEEAVRDTAIMAQLIEHAPNAITTYVEDPVFDIDDPSDLDAADSWLRTKFASSWQGRF